MAKNKSPNSHSAGDDPDLAELYRRRELIQKILAARKRKETARAYEWRGDARPKQLPPEGDDWHVWLITAGRGFGKSWTGSGWITESALTAPGTVWGAIGATVRDTRDVPIRAIRARLDAIKCNYTYNKTDLQIFLPNGSEIIGYSADNPDRIRGANLAGAWCDELAHFRYADTLWTDALVPAVRIGEHPRIVVTTTPRPTKLMKGFLARDDGSVVVVRGSTFENEANLSKAALAELKRRYDGTRIGRQELYGELLEGAEHALWTEALIEAVQATGPIPPMARTIVAVDPSGSAEGDATGIVVLGIDAQGVIYVLADYTTGGQAQHRYEAMCTAANRHGAGTILYEREFGGDNIAHGVQLTWQSMLASGKVTGLCPMLEPCGTKGKGKRDRAQPVVALYEQHAQGYPRIVHASVFPKLEDEMIQWEPDCGWSPNAMDSLVHGVRELAPRYGAIVYESPVDLPPLPSLAIR